MISKSLREYLDGESLFSAIANEASQAFDFINGNIEALDLLLENFHGSKRMYQPLIVCALPIVAKMIIVKLQARWVDLIAVEALKTNLNKRRELIESTNETQDKTNQRTDINQISGFNSDVMVDNDGASSIGGDGLVGERVRTLIDEEIDPLGSYNSLNAMQKDSIIETVLLDVSGFLTLSIY